MKSEREKRKLYFAKMDCLNQDGQKRIYELMDTVFNVPYYQKDYNGTPAQIVNFKKKES